MARTLYTIIVTGLLAGALATAQGSEADRDQAADLANGERKARACLGCHNVDNFAGQDEATLLSEFRAIAAGERAHISLPSSISDQDMIDIAAFLATSG